MLIPSVSIFSVLSALVAVVDPSMPRFCWSQGDREGIFGVLRPVVTIPKSSAGGQQEDWLNKGSLEIVKVPQVIFVVC